MSEQPTKRNKALPLLERRQWLLEWIKKNRFADVLNSDLVDDYIAETGASFKPTCWGAHKCDMLGRDLSEMARCSALKRFRNSLGGGSWQPGFPKWVWCYEIGPAAYIYEK